MHLYIMKSLLNLVPDQLGPAAVNVVITEYNVPQAKGKFTSPNPFYIQSK